jgi:hypothetical protein
MLNLTGFQQIAPYALAPYPAADDVKPGSSVLMLSRHIYKQAEDIPLQTDIKTANGTGSVRLLSRTQSRRQSLKARVLHSRRMCQIEEGGPVDWALKHAELALQTSNVNPMWFPCYHC